MIRLLTDEHIPSALVAVLRARGVDVARVQDVGLSGTPDPDILEWAAANDRVLVTFDRRTMPGFAFDRVTVGRPMPGVIVLDEAAAYGTVQNDLLVAAECGEPDDFRDRVVYLPM